ncbi:MAG: zinc ribbon domain-containing protein [Candidatus Omnitrophica bacterium]|nr:zinc ribbon domain-containing protein [Candidatus Omnitrophota bacterium]MDD5238172.1 zinc ribbon domain-containing protein [Candidatus Omnitrophota bacterium]
MPTYEYECKHCGYAFEVSQKMTDKHLSACPKCNKEVRRLISSGAGIIFKGKGFYATDYRKKEKSKDKQEEKCNACPQAKEGCQMKQQLS